LVSLGEARRARRDYGRLDKVRQGLAKVMLGLVELGMVRLG